MCGCQHKKYNVTPQFKDGGFVSEISNKDKIKYFSYLDGNRNNPEFWNPESDNDAFGMLNEKFSLDYTQALDVLDAWMKSRGLKKFEGGGTIESELKDFDLSNLDDYEERLYNDYIKHSTKEEALQLLINSVEGDYSQLSPELSEIAEKYYGDVEYAKGGYVQAKGFPQYSKKGDYKYVLIESSGLRSFSKWSNNKSILEKEIEFNKKHNDWDLIIVETETPTTYAKGGSVESLEKELRKLQRDLNSSRLGTYVEGDNSEEQKARNKEREVKLARFNEVLKLLREQDSKFADGSIVGTGLYDANGKEINVGDTISINLKYDSEKWYYSDGFNAWYKIPFKHLQDDVYSINFREDILYCDDSDFDKETNQPKSEDAVVQVDFYNAFDEDELRDFFSTISKDILDIHTNIGNDLFIDTDGELLNKLQDTTNTLFVIKQVADYHKVSGESDDFKYDLVFRNENDDILFSLDGRYNDSKADMPTELFIENEGAVIFNGYPTDGFGNFSELEFYKKFYKAYNEILPVYSSVIAYEGYAIEEEILISRSREEAEEKLEDMKGKLSYHVVEGKQIGKKLVGKVWNKEENEEFAKGGKVNIKPLITFKSLLKLFETEKPAIALYIIADGVADDFMREKFDKTIVWENLSKEEKNTYNENYNINKNAFEKYLVFEFLKQYYSRADVRKSAKGESRDTINAIKLEMIRLANKYDSNKYKRGGVVIEVVGKGNKGAFRKREYEGMSELDVINWWEERGYELSKSKSESKLKPYTFFINKFENGGNVKEEKSKADSYYDKQESFEFGTPVIHHYLDYDLEPQEQSGEVVLNSDVYYSKGRTYQPKTVKGISLYGNKRSIKQNFIVPNWNNVETFFDADKRVNRSEVFEIKEK